MMNEAYSLILSSGEIYVLSGLMGYASVFAVEDDTLKKWQPILKQQVQEVMYRLEKRMLILCEPSGTVYWNEQAARMIRCLCEPQTVGLITGSNDAGRRTDTYALRRNKDVVTIRKMTTDTYNVKLMQEIPCNVLLPKNSEGIVQELHIQMPLAEAQYVREALDTFDLDRAEECARKYAPDSVETVLNVLSGSHRFVRMQFQQRKEGYYSSAWHSFLVISGEHLIRFRMDNREQLYIDSVSVEKVLSEVSAAFDPDGILKERGSQ